MLILATIVLASQLILVLYVLRLHSRNPASAGKFVLLLVAAGCVFAAFQRIAALFIFFFAALYFLALTRRLRRETKFLTATAFFFFLTYFFFLIAGVRDHIVRLSFFNFFITAPFVHLAELNIFPERAWTEVLMPFVSTQSALWCDYWKGFFLLLSYFFTYSFFLLFGMYAPDTEGPPPLSEFTAPRIVLPFWIFFLVAGAGVFSFRGLTLVSMEAFGLLSALLVIQGLAVLSIFIGVGRSGLLLLFLIFCLSLFSREIIAAVLLLGLIDLALGLRRFIPREVFSRGADTAHAPPPNFRRAAAGTIVTACVIVAGALTVAGLRFDDKHSGPRYPAARLPETPGRVKHLITVDETRVHTPGFSFSIDRYEYPNATGKMPLSGVTLDEARRLCALRGKRLCRPSEWAAACAAGPKNRVSFVAGDVSDSTANNALAASCSWMGMWDEDHVKPGGSLPRCVNPFGIHDMMGNVWEWVDAAGEFPGYAGLMGPAGRTGCGICRRCDWMAVVFEDQLPRVNTALVGFRCCGDAKRRDEK